MCANCISNAEAAAAWAGVAAFVLKPRVHKVLANCGLAPEPDPVANDVRTVAFLRALDLDPVESLGAATVAQADSWVADTSWVPLRDRFAASTRPIDSHSLATVR